MWPPGICHRRPAHRMYATAPVRPPPPRAVGVASCERVVRRMPKTGWPFIASATVGVATSQGSLRSNDSRPMGTIAFSSATLLNVAKLEVPLASTVTAREESDPGTVLISNAWCRSLASTVPKRHRRALAASLGLEPRQTDPESVVLPLHYEAVVVVARRVERGEKGVKPASLLRIG
jgi:hypothetical protein